MVTPDEGPVFLLKKLGGLLLVMFGGGLTAARMNLPSTGLTAFGILLLIVGLFLLILKIIRRNERINQGRQSYFHYTASVAGARRIAPRGRLQRGRRNDQTRSAT